MGLDVIWKLPDGKEEPKFDPPLQLIGGLFSGHGEGSFRGKVYAGYIQQATGHDLYEDLTNEQVREIAKSLKQINTGKDEHHDDLLRMFETYAEAGATTYAWY